MHISSSTVKSLPSRHESSFFIGPLSSSLDFPAASQCLPAGDAKHAPVSRRPGSCFPNLGRNRRIPFRRHAELSRCTSISRVPSDLSASFRALVPSLDTLVAPSCRQARLDATPKNLVEDARFLISVHCSFSLRSFSLSFFHLFFFLLFSVSALHADSIISLRSKVLSPSLSSKPDIVLYFN